MNVWSLFASFGLGILTSLATWIIFAWILAPRLRWSEQLASRPAMGAHRREEAVRVKNIGHRAVVDLRVICVLHIPTGHHHDDSYVCRLATSGVSLPMLSRGGTRTFSILPRALSDAQFEELPPVAASALRESDSIETLLRALPGSGISFYVSATDNVSGTYRMFKHEGDYDIGSIVRGWFIHKSLEIQVDNEEAR